MLEDEDTKHDGSLKAEILSYELLNEQDTPVQPTFTEILI